MKINQSAVPYLLLLFSLLIGIPLLSLQTDQKTNEADITVVLAEEPDSNEYHLVKLPQNEMECLFDDMSSKMVAQQTP